MASTFWQCKDKPSSVSAGGDSDEQGGKKQGDGGRFKGTTFQDLLDLENVEVPEYLRIKSNPHLGDEDLSVDRYISQEFFDRERDHMWSRVWQMVCREEDIAEPGDHHVYNIIDSSVIVTRTPSGSIKGYINSCLHRGRCLGTSQAP